jgi:predicted MFS family arabinose efflux permease
MKKYTKVLVNSSHVTHALMNVVIIYLYFNDTTAYHEGFAMLMFPFMAFCLFKTAMCIGYYMIQSSIKAEEHNRQAIGSVMSNLLVVGIFAGNVIAITFSELKLKFNK